MDVLAVLTGLFIWFVVFPVVLILVSFIAMIVCAVVKTCREKAASRKTQPKEVNND